MNRSMSRVAVVVILLFALVLGGCSRSDGVPTLIWWQVGTRQLSFARDQKVISDYVYDKIGVRVEFRLASWADASQRFNTLVNAGEYFDIMFTDSGNYNRFASLGAFADITDLVPEVAPELLEVIPSVLWDGVRINNRIFSVPTFKDSSITGFYFWDSAFVEKYDIDLTRSGWSYLDKVFHRVKQGEGPRFYPLTLARSSNTWIFSNYDCLLANFPPIGVRMDDGERRVVLTLEQPDIVESFRYFNSWFENGIINPDANLIHEVPRGIMFMMAQAWPSVAPLFAAQEGIERFKPVRFFGPIYSTASIQGSMNGISVNSMHKEDALRLLQLVNTDATLRDMLAYGIEGRHFSYVDVDGRRAVHAENPNWSLTNYQQGNYFIITPQDTVPPSYWDEVRYQNETAVPSVMMGFMMDLEPVMIELTNARIIWERNATDLIVGAANPDVVLPRLIGELRTAGLDKIMAEAQRQVDEFFRQR